MNIMIYSYGTSAIQMIYIDVHPNTAYYNIPTDTTTNYHYQLYRRRIASERRALCVHGWFAFPYLHY